MTSLQKLIDRCVADEKREQKVIDKLKAEVAELRAHKCYACGQDFHDDNHETVLAAKERALQEAALQALATNTQWLENTDALRALEPLGDRPVTHYATESEAVRHSSELEALHAKIDAKRAEIDPYSEQLAEQTEVKLGARPTTLYATEQEAVAHKTKVANLEQQIVTKSEEADPYSEQIAEMEGGAIQVVDYASIDELNRILKHQEYVVSVTD